MYNWIAYLYYLPLGKHWNKRQLFRITKCSEIFFFSFWEFHACSIFKFLGHWLEVILINNYFSWSQDWCFNEAEIWVTIKELNMNFKRMFLTQRVFWEARWRAFQIDSCSWQKCRSIEDSSFCGKWSALPWPFCPWHRPCFQREQLGCSHRLWRDPCTTWGHFGR